MAVDGLKKLASVFRRSEAPTRDDALKEAALQAINKSVENFLASRGVEDFRVYTLEYGGHPVVLIKAKPQKKLRYSNILEAQIRQMVQKHMNIDVPAVFWRFKVDYEMAPGPEQADYDYDEAGSSMAEEPTQPMPDGQGTESAEQEEPATVIDHLYDVRHSLRTGMAVEEVEETLDFEAFLQGNASQPAAPPQSDKSDKSE